MTARRSEFLCRRVLIAATLAGAMSVAGCTNPFNPLVAPERGIYIAPPEASSPEGVIRLFEWCWDNRSYEQYREIFTKDFQFQFATTDEAGNPFENQPIRRDEEIEIAKHLFVGGGSSPPASHINLTLGRSLIADDDLRPGKNQTYHRMIFTDVVLYIDTEGEDFNVVGKARFFVVRGDSAQIPEDLRNQGFGPDPGRWYIDRWEDETEGSGPSASSALIDRRGPGGAAGRHDPRKPDSKSGSSAASTPLSVTWGFVKAFYFPQR
jgi:hypothetical protein